MLQLQSDIISNEFFQVKVNIGLFRLLRKSTYSFQIRETPRFCFKDAGRISLFFWKAPAMSLTT